MRATRTALDMSVTIAGIELKNPVIAASGTFGYGIEFEDIVTLDRLGGFVVKGLSREPMAGNPPPRLFETAAGMLNAIGLQNIGAKAFVEVVPHHQVVPPPSMQVGELALGGMREELIEQCAALAVRRPDDTADVRCDIQRLASVFRDGPHDHLRHRRQVVALALGEIGEPGARTGGGKRMHRDQPFEPPLHRVGQCVVGGAQVGELGVTADRRDAARIEDRGACGQILERAVRMP